MLWGLPMLCLGLFVGFVALCIWANHKKKQEAAALAALPVARPVLYATTGVTVYADGCIELDADAGGQAILEGLDETKRQLTARKRRLSLAAREVRGAHAQRVARRGGMTFRHKGLLNAVERASRDADRARSAREARGYEGEAHELERALIEVDLALSTARAARRRAGRAPALPNAPSTEAGGEVLELDDAN